MTRYPPGQSQEGYGYQQQQQPYGQSQGSYGYGNEQSYHQPPQNYQQESGYAENRGQAESYYGSNQHAYQQYPQQSGAPGGEGYYHQSQPHTYGEHSYGQPAYGSPAPQYNEHQYGGPPPPHQSNPGYGEGYHQQHYMQQPSGEVDAFKSQFDQPHVAPGQYGQYPPPGAEEDRGLMGALAGGAAGAYGGHKMGHGIIGGIGGAVAGSMLEDAYKKHNKKDKKEKKHKSHSRRGSSSSSSSSSSDDSDHHKKHRGAFAGNFHASSRGMRLEQHCVLVAECCDTNGHHRWSSLDLNQCLTNSNGRLEWARGGMFGASARNVHLTDGGAVLECELGDGRGGWAYNKVHLGERITNDDGRLEFLG